MMTQLTRFLADILDRVSPKFDELGLSYECLGGGRIRHDKQQKTIHIYGYSVVSGVGHYRVPNACSETSMCI